MSYRNHSKVEEIGCTIQIIIYISIAIVFAIKLINSDSERILDIISDVWTWVIIFTVSSIIGGILSYYYRNKIQKLNSTIKDSENVISKLNRDYNDKIMKLDKEIVNLNECICSKDEFYNSMSSFANMSVIHMTELISDFKLVQYDISATHLRTKSHPAYGEAQRIAELKKETKLYHEQYKQMLYKYEALLGLFPELATYVDDFDSIKELNDFKNIDSLQNDYDRVRDYISKDEYIQLSINEKNQLALNRYINGKKSKWQIGRDYEMYIASLYRKAGWGVVQYGIEKKLEDLGRDLIVYSKDKIHIVQCKYWSQTKLIHEKHIAQLYGSTIEFSLSENDIFRNSVVPEFITNIELSETAKRFANVLNVKIHKIEMDEFPRIKCNINNGEKIYHLPFDQQYDRTKIENEGEFYAYTISEATNAGFRRAFRHFA